MKPFLFLITGMVFFCRRRRAFVDMNPRYRGFLKREKLNAPEVFLSLPAVIVSGHPDRNVARVRLGTTRNGSPGSTEIAAYLKREHRLSWRDRLTNAWAGFGWCSKSYREGLVLRALREQGVSCPEFLAAGEDDFGRAFLLVRELPESVDLRLYLREKSSANLRFRRHIMRELGETVARLHEAGFNHPDLYSKHVVVSPERSAVSLLDCQRSHRLPRLTWRQRWHDLAALDATLTDELITSRERIGCLRSYLRASLATRAPKRFYRQALMSIRRQATRLLRHRHVREARQIPLSPGSQNLIWVQGESLCVTRQFHDALEGRIPVKLLRGRRHPFPSALDPQIWARNGSDGHVTRCRYSFRATGAAILVQRRASRPWQWLWSRVRGRRLTSPELDQAGIIFRLQRYCVRTVEVLAFGQSLGHPWQLESFLLLRDHSTGISLAEWLTGHADSRWSAEAKQRRRIIREAGTLLRRMHEACCYLPARLDNMLVVEMMPVEGPGLLLASVEGILKRRKSSGDLAKRNLIALARMLALAGLSRTERLRFVLSYVGQQRLTPSTKKLIRDLQI
jgi:serine/threonine protein kinase